MLTGKALIETIDRCQPAKGGCALWWFGQHSFVVKSGGWIFYLDPFLSALPDRKVPPLLKPHEIVHANFILGSHDHVDHIDRDVWPGLAKASPNAKFVVPDLLQNDLADALDISEDRFIGIDDCQSFEHENVRITGIAAAHEFLDVDEQTGRHPYLGYVIEVDNCTIYHAGDTCIYEGLQTKLKQWDIDVALLPINGRDAKRLAAGCIGNMTYQEAADLAGNIEPKLTIPTHYDMFQTNSADPKLFIDYMAVKYPQLATFTCHYAETLEIAGQ